MYSFFFLVKYRFADNNEVGLQYEQTFLSNLGLSTTGNAVSPPSSTSFR